MAHKIKINTRPVADSYTFDDERIIEYSSPNGGGLINFRLMPDGKLAVECYRHDSTVRISIGEQPS